MTEGYSMWVAIKGGWFILSVLFATSILSVTVIVERYLVLKKARLDARSFGYAVFRQLKEGGALRAVEFCKSYNQPMAQVVYTLLTATGEREERERAFRHTLRTCSRELQTHVPILGTIGSIAPFVGLFGTVWGIMKAFRDIAVHSAGGPGVVAAGISEALITTAFGLLVAIPAIIAYNAFVTSIRRTVEEIDITTNELLDEIIHLENKHR